MNWNSVIISEKSSNLTSVLKKTARLNYLLAPSQCITSHLLEVIIFSFLFETGLSWNALCRSGYTLLLEVVTYELGMVRQVRQGSISSSRPACDSQCNLFWKSTNQPSTALLLPTILMNRHREALSYLSVSKNTMILLTFSSIGIVINWIYVL